MNSFSQEELNIIKDAIDNSNGPNIRVNINNKKYLLYCKYFCFATGHGGLISNFKIENGSDLVLNPEIVLLELFKKLWKFNDEGIDTIVVLSNKKDPAPGSYNMIPTYQIFSIEEDNYNED